jgi:hypothetical protein
MASGLNEYLDFLREGLQEPGEFNPQPYYNVEADALFFFARDTPSYAKRLNPFITLFLASEDDTLVGVKLKSIKRIIGALRHLDDDLKVFVIDHKIKLGILLALAKVPPPEHPELEPYKHDLDRFQDVEIEEQELVPA